MHHVPLTRRAPKEHVKAALVRAFKRESIRTAIEEHNYDHMSDVLLLSTIQLPLSPYDSRRISLSRKYYGVNSESMVDHFSSFESVVTANKKQQQQHVDHEDDVENKRRSTSSTSKKRMLAVADTSFVSCSDIIYYGEISLGTPKQTLQVYSFLFFLVFA
jgi:hypothetical protein